MIHVPTLKEAIDDVRDSSIGYKIKVYYENMRFYDYIDTPAYDAFIAVYGDYEIETSGYTNGEYWFMI